MGAGQRCKHGCTSSARIPRGLQARLRPQAPRWGFSFLHCSPGGRGMPLPLTRVPPPCTPQTRSRLGAWSHSGRVGPRGAWTYLPGCEKARGLCLWGLVTPRGLGPGRRQGGEQEGGRRRRTEQKAPQLPGAHSPHFLPVPEVQEGSPPVLLIEGQRDPGASSRDLKVPMAPPPPEMCVFLCQDPGRG